MANLWKSFLVLLTLPVIAHSEMGITYTDSNITFFQQIYNNLASSGVGQVSNQTASDLIFIIDRPGRGTAYAVGFHILLGFIQSFLEKISVSTDSTRVALVVSDGLSCSVTLNDAPSGDLTKCGVVYKLRKLRMQVI